MKYRSILFDLDGTLTDPYPGIKNSIKYSLEKFRIFEEDDSRLKLFVGPPLEKSFMEFYSFDKKTAQKAIEYYREYFSEKGIYENTLYDGIENLLRELNGRNAECVLATSKPLVFARKILAYFHLNTYFKDVMGSGLDGSFTEKEDIISHIVKKHGINKQDAVMIGDRIYDVAGANKAGIDSIAVLYGYGSKEELEIESPKYLCASVADLLKLLTGEE
ncbi:MAG: HAD hydrolase-like protein [Spirochaetaceae bacterium]|nr:HAD hydrolase-like protein [Spirochaetaceae bacterium]